MLRTLMKFVWKMFNFDLRPSSLPHKLVTILRWSEILPSLEVATKPFFWFLHVKQQMICIYIYNYIERRKKE